MSVLEHPLMSGAAPEWATVWGEDRFGVFAGFQVGAVVHRLRWIPGGRFLMGSPEVEKKWAYQDETQHEVEVDGFWLGETAVTQDFWVAVTGEPIGRFQSPRRPVESVSWEDAQQFIRRLNEMVAGLECRLPWEAEWEFGCRAGSRDATYHGPLDLVGQNNAPVLDEIAWYGGNSGVGFELSDGYDSSDWPEKQFPHTRAGTCEVARKRPNAHGLFDMLGNVWEWCQDWLGPYPKGPVVNPRGPESGDHRVIRGGAWFSNAQNVRSGNRSGNDPGYRRDYLGFRLARGQVGLKSGKGSARSAE